MKSSNVETDVRRRTAAKEESYSEFRAIFIFGFHSDFTFPSLTNNQPDMDSNIIINPTWTPKWG
eukprot:scaffold2512_cov232-Chaetoceros_neogracile.AAC.9